MPVRDSKTDEQIQIDVSDIGLSLKKKKRYCVMLDGVRSEVETAASFALKFSLLANLPVTKVKHMMRSVPATVWKGKRKVQAISLLNLIEEAGGAAHIEEEEYAPDMEQVVGGKAVKGKVCSQCGFPIKDEDLFCNFCMTPISDEKRSSVQVKAPRRKPSSAAYRYLFFLLLGFFAIVLYFTLRG
jgi:hypothetical protein